jgi:ABC-type phosphate/phosphonate transport system substrate-binding protein
MVPFGDCDDAKIVSVTFGYMESLFNNLTKKDAKIATEIWLNEVASRTKELKSVKMKTVIYHDLPSLIAAVRAKQVDFVALTSLDYFQVKDKISLEPALTYIVGEKPGTIYYLVVSKDKESFSLNRLKNKKLIVQKTDESGQVPLLWLNTLLRKQGLPTANVLLGSVKMVETPSQAILPVFFKQADCCLVTLEGFETSQELNPQIGERLAIVTRSPSLMIGLLAVRKDLSDTLRKGVTEVAVNLASYPRGKQILTLFKIGGFRYFQTSDLDSVQELIKEQNKYK